MLFESADRKAFLFHGVTVAKSDRVIFKGVEVDGDAAGCADFIVATIAFSDSP